MKRLCGIGVSPRQALGILRFYPPREPASSLHALQSLSPEEGIARFRAACEQAEHELRRLSGQMRQQIGTEESDILAVQAMLVRDPDFTEAVEGALKEGKALPEALRMGCDAVCAILLATEDDYLAGRAADMRDITERLRRILQSDPDAEESKKDPFAPDKESALPLILAAHELPPSVTATIRPELVAGIAEEAGSVQGHTAILCRTLGLAAVADLKSLPREYEGHRALILGEEGILLIDPDEAAISAYESRMEQDRARARELDALRGKESITRDGKRIRLYANAATPAEIESAMKGDAEGIGLLRSEVLFLSSKQAPDEQTQTDFYRACIEKAAGKPIILRTLDIGADKIPDYFPKRQEENPALGLRAIRHSLVYPTYFRTQLRAILRAATEGPVHLMLPLITSVEEIREAKRILSEVERELSEQGIAHSLPKSIGIMIETPAAAITADLLAREVDFFSIGSNDLVQYTLAADRQDPLLSSRFPLSPLPPSLLRLIGYTVHAAHEAGIWCGLCGEIGSETAQIEALLDLGLDELSVLPSSVLPIRSAIRHHTSSHRERSTAMPIFSRRAPASTLLSPASGRLIPLESVPDEAFAKKLLGEGFAVSPTENTVYAPANGKIESISETGHAITLLTEDGLDLLIHVGVDTVSLSREVFQAKARPGDAVKAGQPLMTFDKSAIEGAALPTDVILIVTSGDALSSFVTECGEAKGGATVAAHYVTK